MLGLQPEERLRPVGRLSVFVVVALVTPLGLHAQEPSAARQAYFDAVAGFFRLPPKEVAILGEWGIRPDEIPAVLFIARHAGVSAEAVVALRRSGQGWSQLSERYGIGAPALHLPIRDDAPAGALEGAYRRYREVPVSNWHTIRLSDGEVVGLVNVRVIAGSLGLSIEEVIRHTSSIASYVELFVQLSG